MEARCEENGSLDKIPDTIHMSLIQRLAKDGAPSAEGNDNGWVAFLKVVLPWQLDDVAGKRTLAAPAVRFLDRVLPEMIRFSERLISEKLLTLVRSGADSKNCLTSLCLKMLGFMNGDIPATHVRPGSTAEDLSRLAAFRKEVGQICDGILAVGAVGKLGEYDGACVKKVTANGKSHPNSMSGIISAALATSGYWQERLRCRLVPLGGILLAWPKLWVCNVKVK